MAKQTTFMKFPYADDLDPNWDDYEAQLETQDEAAFMAKIQNNLFIAGGGTVLLNTTSGLVTWTSDFIIPVFHYGFRLNVKFGPDDATRSLNVPDGSALVVEIPYSMSTNVDVNFASLSQLTPINHQQWVAGWRYGNKIYFKGLGII